MIPGNINTDLISGADEVGYQVTRSLRFNSSDSAYCDRSFTSAGNRKTWTFAAWVKLSALTGTNSSGGGTLFHCRNGTGDDGITDFLINTDGTVVFTGGASTWLTTTQVLRDFSAWYHLVMSVDTTAATASNRLRLYINGSQVTTFNVNVSPTQNSDLAISQAATHRIGGRPSFSQFFNGYLADVHFIDGQALTPSSFGQADATTGEWVPIAYTGTYGTNGFKLNFSNNSAATATTLGADSSGNGNNWTPNNLSVTAGAGNDSLVDTPTSYGTDTGVGGEVRGNYATLNPLSGAGTLANGNLDFSSSVGHCTRNSTIGVTSGKWYGEFTFASSSVGGIGITSRQNAYSAWPDNTAGNYWVYSDASSRYIYPGGGTPQSQAGSLTAGTWQIALDLDNARCWVGYQGTWYNATWGTNGDPATGANPTFSSFPAATYFPFLETNSTAWSFNFGQRPFAYTAPSGYKALCDTNLPAPTIVKPSTVMDVKLWTGNGTSQTISGFGFSPDLVWVKNRTRATANHALYDTVRGRDPVLATNTTAAELTGASVSQDLTAFNSDGFSLGTVWNGDLNRSAEPYVAWAWDAGSSTVTNTQGSITSQVRANASAGFSVVTYTGNVTYSTIGHGLGIRPSLIIVKSRTGTTNWAIYHSSLGASAYLYFNTAAVATDNVMWQGVSPTSSVFSVGNYNENNGSNTYVAYCFAPVAGYSAFGSYTGNNNADGPFQWCGFRPRWLLIKSVGYAADWIIIDAARETYNVMQKALFPNRSYYEAQASTALRVDFLSNGFKIRSTDGNAEGWNYPNNAHVWAAFAENPFQYARAR